jgi:hypothetical protein
MDGTLFDDVPRVLVLPYGHIDGTPVCVSLPPFQSTQRRLQTIRETIPVSGQSDLL